MATYLIDGRRISSTSPKFQKMLDCCRKRQIAVHCACKSPSPIVVIAKKEDVYFLRRLPHDGASHAAHCIHHALPPSVSGHHTIADATTSLANGKTKIKIAARLSEQGLRAQGQRSVDPDKPVRAKSPKPASLKAFGERLFERAGLTEWRPEFRGKRNYRNFRERIETAASTILVSSRELAARLFVPEAYDPESKNRQAKAARDWFETFGADLPGKQFAILIAELKDVSETKYGGRLDLNHLYEKMFFLDDTAYSKILAKLEKLEDRFEGCEWIRYIVIATCEWRGRYAMVRELEIICINKNFIPIYSPVEEKGMRKFEGSCFTKCLRFDERYDKIMASVVLTGQEPNIAVFFCDRTSRNKKEAYSAAEDCEMEANVIEI